MKKRLILLLFICVSSNCLSQINEIGFSSIRGGNIPGEHTVIFHGENESIELTHRAFNRKIFSDGAIEAAIWVSRQKSGYYTYKDIL